MIKLVLIGSGKFGKNYISTLNGFDNISLSVANRDNWKKLIDDKPDGVMVCTPPQSHIEISSYALERNIPVMVEKPLALSLQECLVLKQYTAPILVNHIHLFSDIYQNIKSHISTKDIKCIYSMGMGNSPDRDYSRLWDYGPHDIAMILDLTQQYPYNINCYRSYDGTNYSEKKLTIRMRFDTFESISEIGFGPIRQRYLSIDGSFIYDGMVKELPLTNAIKVFIDAIGGKPDYRLGLDLSLKVMQVLEFCQKSLNIDA